MICTLDNSHQLYVLVGKYTLYAKLSVLCAVSLMAKFSRTFSLLLDWLYVTGNHSICNMNHRVTFSPNHFWQLMSKPHTTVLLRDILLRRTSSFRNQICDFSHTGCSRTTKSPCCHRNSTHAELLGSNYLFTVTIWLYLFGWLTCLWQAQHSFQVIKRDGESVFCILSGIY